MTSPLTSAPDCGGNTGNLHKSLFQQTVCLADWWLVKAENDVEGRRLAVAGFTAWGKQAMRVFTSAPILKRYDVCTVETSDGICVILDGFINKARTLENGFPSDVFNYFVFGFPPYWKEYDEKFVAKVSASKGISRDDLLEKKLSEQLGSMEGAQPHVDSLDKISESQGKKKARGRLKKCSLSSLEKESYAGGKSNVENHTAPEPPPPVNDLKNGMKSLSYLSDVGIKVEAAIDKHADCSKSHGSGGTLSACHLNKKRAKEAAYNLRKMDREKKTRTNFDLLEMKQMNNKKAVEISDAEKIRLNSISSTDSGKLESETVFDRKPGSRDNWNPEDKGIREIKTKSKIPKVKMKATELPCTPASSEKSSRSPASVKKGRDTETPKSEKEKVQSVSPQSFSFNRSRSGRLLMPTLEFWRNQRAVYDVDRTITRIDEGTSPTAHRKWWIQSNQGEWLTLHSRSSFS